MGHIDTSIDRLIKIVQEGGSFRTGLDIYNSKKEKTIENTSIIKDADILLKLKTDGIQMLPISRQLGGGTWDKDGNELKLTRKDSAAPVAKEAPPEPTTLPGVEKKNRKNQSNQRRGCGQV